jgi:hypothetical protein
MSGFGPYAQTSIESKATSKAFESAIRDAQSCGVGRAQNTHDFCAT